MHQSAGEQIECRFHNILINNDVSYLEMRLVTGETGQLSGANQLSFYECT